jgi:hypothetical protein
LIRFSNRKHTPHHFESHPKFTRTDADTLMYEFTIDDPSVWMRPFTAVVPMHKSDQPIYEYACHEGNYALASILAGARAAEKAAEAKASK